jgi:fibro-slime domain-containing protein
MRPHLALAAACGAVLAVGSVAQADTIQLSGVIRDFKAIHSDFQRTGPNFEIVRNMVLPDLGADKKPALNVAGLASSYRIESPDSFNQWFRDVPGVNITIPHAITLDNHQEGPGGVYSFAIERPVYFFPIDGMGWGDVAKDKNGNYRNFYFTYEIHTQFTYTDPASRSDAMVFSFTGDDDVWVFINGKLAVDIGGVHAQKSSSVNLDSAAEQLGLVPGNTYDLDFFFAERYVTESNFRIETTIQLQDVAPTTISPLYD